jgi:SAM-dependent methyltransferase
MANLGVHRDSAIGRGHYAAKQICCGDRLISWSHRRRFATGLQLAAPLAGGRVLDYGCGDGTFLAFLLAGAAAPSLAVGAEIHPSLVEDCRGRLGGLPGISFLTVEELDAPAWAASFDGLVCMEVLEHVVDWIPPLDRWERLLAPGGRVIVSVPVETGPALLIKQTARRVAGWRGLGDYPGQSPYTPWELFRGVFAGGRQHMPRPVHRAADGSPNHDHKGFNWRVLRAALAARFQLERIVTSPLRFLPPALASQVWFLLRKR